MAKVNNPLDSIDQIKSIMERSTTFMSLTGLSGILAGLFGLLTTILVSFELNSIVLNAQSLSLIASDRGLRILLAMIAIGALSLTLLTALFLTLSKARKRGHDTWDAVARRFAAHLFIPLIAGGLFTISLAYFGQLQFICPAMLLFFGLSLLNAAHFVQMDMFWLGIIEISLGVVVSFWHLGGLIFWGLGFGIAPLVYGSIMYYKYER